MLAKVRHLVSVEEVVGEEPESRSGKEKAR